MNRFKYTVNGISPEEFGERTEQILKSVFPEAEAILADAEARTLEFSLPKKSSDRDITYHTLSGAFAAMGYDLVGGEETDKYVYLGETPKRTKKVPLAIAVSLAIICSVVCILATYVICGFSGIINPHFNVQGGDTVSDAPDQLDIPSYVQEVLKLDTAFKEFSYDGIDEEKMKEAILDAYIAATGDLYAEYMNAEEYEAYFADRVGEFVGIGVSIVNSEIELQGRKYKVLQVISVFKDSPALESGVKVGDCIMYVDNGGEPTLVDVLGYTQALDVMLGEEGSLANFVVYRPSGSDYEQIEFSIKRRKVVTESVNFRVSETDSKVGIVNITGFDATTAPQLETAIETLKASGCERFVLDVRNNPGGSLDSIISVLSRFLETGDEIVSTEYSDGYKETEYVRTRRYAQQYSGCNVDKDDIGKYKDLPCIVITNGNTASAAELFTATLRDYKIAKVVGETTYGKGCMQSILPLESYGLEGGLRVTVAMYFSASKEIYHGIGIKPDIEVALGEEALEYNFFLLPEEKDDQLLKAIEELLK